MQKLLVISGKGGTGKTTVAGGLLEWLAASAAADCDVEGPNLHLLLNPQQHPQQKGFFGTVKAEIDSACCTDCGLCAVYCRFGAIKKSDHGYAVDRAACEGCGVCQRLCPGEAIALKPYRSGTLQLFPGPPLFSTAQLAMGSGHSGLLVAEVKRQLLAAESSVHWAVVDGPPGIGCPVLAALSGADLILIVTEPSISGFHDLRRLVRAAAGFPVPIVVVINKYREDNQQTRQIRSYCRKQNLDFLGHVPFAPELQQAVNDGGRLLAASGPGSQALAAIFRKLQQKYLNV